MPWESPVGHSARCQRWLGSLVSGVVVGGRSWMVGDCLIWLGRAGGVGVFYKCDDSSGFSLFRVVRVFRVGVVAIDVPVAIAECVSELGASNALSASICPRNNGSSSRVFQFETFVLVFLDGKPKSANEGALDEHCRLVTKEPLQHWVPADRVEIAAAGFSAFKIFEQLKSKFSVRSKIVNDSGHVQCFVVVIEEVGLHLKFSGKCLVVAVKVDLG